MTQDTNLGEFLDQKADASGADEGDFRNMVFTDPRIKDLGARIITNDPQ